MNYTINFSGLTEKQSSHDKLADKKKTIGNVSYGLKKFYCRCLSLIKSSWNFLSKMKKTNRAWTYEIGEILGTLHGLFRSVFFYSLSNSFQNNIQKNRHLSIGDENTLKGYLFLTTQMVALSLFYLLYHIFPVIKVRKFEFCIVIRSCLEPWNTQDDTKFTYSVSIHF